MRLSRTAMPLGVVSLVAVLLLTASPATGQVEDAGRTVADGGELEADPPTVGVVECSTLLKQADIDAALGITARLAAGETSGTRGFVGGEVCHEILLYHEESFLILEPGDLADFEPGALVEESEGRAIPGIGDRALLFRTVEGGDSGVNVLSVRQERDVGELVFRLTLARPDLDSPARSLLLAEMARVVLPRFPGTPIDDVIPASAADLGPESEEVDLAAFTFTDNLFAKEMAGEWTRGEGLVATLQLLAGERGSEDVLRHGEVVEEEATGIIEVALAYLDDGDDDLSKREIERLLRHFVWTDAQLEAMAGITPAPTARGFIQASIRSAQGIDTACETFFHSTRVDTPCMFYDTIDVPEAPPGKYRMFVPSFGFPQGGWTPRHYAMADAAVKRAAKWYETLGNGMAWSVGSEGSMPAVNVVFTLNPAKNAYANASDVGTCGVAFHPLLQTKSDAVFAQAVAHELGHCFQFGHFAAQRGAGQQATKWWTEGGAEYLSNLIYPKTDFEWRWEKLAMTRSKRVTLIDLGYGAFHFWEFVDDHIGTDGIFELILSLPSSGGRHAVEEKLGAYSGIADLYQSFFEAQVDGSIADTASGRVMKPTPMTVQEVTAPLVDELDFRPFGSVGLFLSAPECMQISTGIEGASSRASARPDALKGWTDVPTIYPEPSSDHRDRKFAITAIESTVVETAFVPVEQTLAAEACEPTDPPPGLTRGSRGTRCDFCDISDYIIYRRD